MTRAPSGLRAVGPDTGIPATFSRSLRIIPYFPYKRECGIRSTIYSEGLKFTACARHLEILKKARFHPRRKISHRISPIREGIPDGAKKARWRIDQPSAPAPAQFPLSTERDSGRLVIASFGKVHKSAPSVAPGCLDNVVRGSDGWPIRVLYAYYISPIRFELEKQDSTPGIPRSIPARIISADRRM